MILLSGNSAEKKQEYTHDLYTQKALAFIEENKNYPFFLYLPYTIPHFSDYPDDSHKICMMSSRKVLFVLSIAVSLIGFNFRDGFAKVYPVGLGQPYESIGDVPWETLGVGDSVLIHHRESSYHEKWVICRTGTESALIVVKGIPNKDGDYPVQLDRRRQPAIGPGGKQ